MIADYQVGLATVRDASRIAEMSRDFIEQGLGWRWTSSRVQRAIRDPAINVAVARDKTALVGFAIMQYKDDEAHLLLLAVDPRYQRKGVGSTLMAWLEATALIAGTSLVYLEARADNAPARAFYRGLGYVEIRTVPRLYSHTEDGVRIAKDLWERPPKSD